MLDRSTPPLTPFRAHFTNGASMGITAATAGEARAIANNEAKKRGTLVSKIKVIKETIRTDGEHELDASIRAVINAKRNAAQVRGLLPRE